MRQNLAKPRWGYSAVILRKPVLTQSELRIVAVSIAAAASLIACAASGLILINDSPSAPIGLYARTLPFQTPTYVSFCLPQKLKDTTFYDMACSPDRPDHTHILKAIDQTDPARGYWVTSPHPQALDSRRIGWVAQNQVIGFWHPLIVWSTTK